MPCRLSVLRNQRGKTEILPGKSEGLWFGDGVGSGALAHAVELVEGNIQAEEELQRVFGDRGGACVAFVAAVQAQGLAYFLKHKLFGNLIAERCTACCCVSGGKKHKKGGSEMSNEWEQNVTCVFFRQKPCMLKFLMN